MTNRQKEILAYRLKKEKELLKDLEKAYQQVSDDLKNYLDKLHRDFEFTGLQSKIYQAKWQKALKKQVDETLERIRSGVFQTIDDYRNNCYEDGFLGAMYDMQGQGVPLIMPIDPEEMIKAVSIDSRLSKSLYESLGIGLDKMKKTIREEISRGIASGMMYEQIGVRIDSRTNSGRYNAVRIARTEGQRIANEATYHAQMEAKERGADIVKQWCGILDGRIRPSHAELHNQIKDMDEYFEVNGHRALYPSGFGVASEDINCRCSLLQRAKWALEDEGDGIIEAENFSEFKRKWNRYNTELNNISGVLGSSTPSLGEYVRISNGSNKGIFDDYFKRIKNEEILNITSFDDFLNKLEEVNEKIVGKVTSDGIEIKSTSLHFVSRSIGNGKDHIEVPVDWSLDTLLFPDEIVYNTKNNSVNYWKDIKGGIQVAVNKESGKLIQCQIIHKRK